MTTLRRAVVEDLDAIRQLNASTAPHQWAETAIERTLLQGQVWLIMADATPVGFLVEHRVLDETTLMHFAIGADFQQQGYGREALSEWLQWLANDGQARCLLEVRASNAAARHLYQALGFTQLDTRPRYYQTDTGFEDAVVMSRELESL